MTTINFKELQYFNGGQSDPPVDWYALGKEEGKKLGSFTVDVFAVATMIMDKLNLWD